MSSGGSSARRLRLAIVGAGHLGRIHARLAQASGRWEIAAIVDSAGAARDALAAETGARSLPDVKDVAGGIDAAIIATPTRVHAETALPLLERGIHTFVEKPLAATVPDAEAIVDAARHAGVILQVGHVERFNPAWTALRSRIEDASYIEAYRASSHAFRSTDIGVVHDLMIHDLDLVLSLCRAPIRRIDAHLLTVVGPHEDIAHARLEFSDNRVALLRASRVSPHTERTMSVYAEHRHAQIDFAAPSLQIIDRSDAIRHGTFDPETLPGPERDRCRNELFLSVLPTTTVPLESRNAIADEQAEFAAAIRGECEPRVNGSRGLRAIRVSQRILEVAASVGRRPDTNIQVAPLPGRLRRAG
jgi:predicted dehydrogenase